MPNKKILIVGAGLAGSEAAYFLARHGKKVILCECKKFKKNEAQTMDGLAELVCSNSLKSTKIDLAHGLLKFEMQHMDSLTLQAAKEAKVPAGDALAVDRKVFSDYVTKKINSIENIEMKNIEVSDPYKTAKNFGCDTIILASGPLTTNPLETWIKENISKDDFYFYDAISPIVDGDSLNYDKLYFKDRYKDIDEGITPDYLNAPLDEDTYKKFIEELVLAKKTPSREFEKLVFFESCLPIDLMAERGIETPRFSCMKPVGLKTSDGELPYAVVQLRRENLLGDAYNLVGFQTRLTYKEQKRIFRMIPGLEDAKFINLGSVHRNSFINAKKLLNFDLSTKKDDKIYFAGQITGVEGYTESAMSGIYVAYQLLKKENNSEIKHWPVETMTGALINYLMTCEVPRPSSVHFGLLPRIEVGKNKKIKKQKLKKIKKMLKAERAQHKFMEFLDEYKLI